MSMSLCMLLDTIAKAPKDKSTVEKVVDYFNPKYVFDKSAKISVPKFEPFKDLDKHIQNLIDKNLIEPFVKGIKDFFHTIAVLGIEFGIVLFFFSLIFHIFILICKDSNAKIDRALFSGLGFVFLTVIEKVI